MIFAQQNICDTKSIKRQINLSSICIYFILCVDNVSGSCNYLYIKGFYCYIYKIKNLDLMSFLCVM